MIIINDLCMTPEPELSFDASKIEYRFESVIVKQFRILAHTFIGGGDKHVCIAVIEQEPSEYQSSSPRISIISDGSKLKCGKWWRVPGFIFFGIDQIRKRWHP